MTDKTKKRIVIWFWILFSFPFVMVAVMLLLVWAFADIPSFEELENPESKLATQVIAEDGEILSTFHIENRSYVSYEELSPYLVEAAVATEDVRFYDHSGIDFISLGRVLVKTLLYHHPAACQDSVSEAGCEQQYPGLVQGEDGMDKDEGMDYGRKA